MCQHNRIQGDNYGETCMDCGEVISGYGYWAEGSKVCKHFFLPEEPQEKGKEIRWICTYCETTVLSIENPNNHE